MGASARRTLGQRIKDLRRKQDFSQEELADRAGIHRTYIGAVERGERNISLDNIVGIAKALGVAPSVLMRGVE
jgi:transcriptional regulator with XRE-family HTH domain